MKPLISIFLISALSGCIDFAGKIADEDLNMLATCTDTRDGEVFTFNTNDIFNIRRSFSGGSFEVKDSNGIDRVFTERMELYIKCTKTRMKGN